MQHAFIMRIGNCFADRNHEAQASGQRVFLDMARVVFGYFGDDFFERNAFTIFMVKNGKSS